MTTLEVGHIVSGMRRVREEPDQVRVLDQGQAVVDPLGAEADGHHADGGRRGVLALVPVPAQPRGGCLTCTRGRMTAGPR